MQAVKVANLITGQVTYLQDESGAHLTLESVTALRPVPGSPNKARPAAEAPPAAARRRRRSDRDHNQSRPRLCCKGGRGGDVRAGEGRGRGGRGREDGAKG